MQIQKECSTVVLINLFQKRPDESKGDIYLHVDQELVLTFHDAITLSSIVFKLCYCFLTDGVHLIIHL